MRDQATQCGYAMGHDGACKDPTKWDIALVNFRWSDTAKKFIASCNELLESEVRETIEIGFDFGFKQGLRERLEELS